MGNPDYRKILDFTPEILGQGESLIDGPSKDKCLRGASAMLVVGGMLLGLAALIASALGEVNTKDDKK